MKTHIRNNLIFIFIAVLALIAFFWHNISSPMYPADMGIPFKDPRTICVEIVKDRKLLVNGKATGTSTFSTQVAKHCSEVGLDFPIVLKAPGNMKFEEVKKIIDYIVDAGAYKIFFQSERGKLFRVDLPGGPTTGIGFGILKDHKYTMDGTARDLVDLQAELRAQYRKRLYLYIVIDGGSTYQDFIDMAEFAVPIGYGLELKSSNGVTNILELFGKLRK